MNKSELVVKISASKEKIWEVLFNQYGDIHVHNPTMISSCYLHDFSKGELDCVRKCNFSEKSFLEEKITSVDDCKSFTVTVTRHNLPFLREMSATYALTSTSKNMIELKMTSFASTSPRFMIQLMKGQLSKSLAKHLFGLKYFIESGKTVDLKTYSKVSKHYQ